MRRNRLAASAVLAASIVSSSCGSDSSGPAGVGFLLNVTSPLGATLGTTQTIDVEIASTNFGGSVTLEVTGAPSDWVIAFAPSATVTVVPGGYPNVSVQVTIPSNGTPAPSGRPLVVKATATSGIVTVNTSLTVANEFILPIVGGMGAHWGARTGTTVTLKAGTLLRIRNDHTDAHIIHTGGNIGMPHQDVSGTGTLAGQSYTATVSIGTDDINCHSHGPATDRVLFNVVP